MSYGQQKKLLKAHEQLEEKKSKDDPCVYYNWNHNGLMAWLNWTDNNLLLGNKKRIEL